MSPTRYRSALTIVQLILEILIREGDNGLVKSQIYKEIGLKTAVGEKYLTQLLQAGYVQLIEEPWGKERVRHRVIITQKGMHRFEWFIRLSSELNL